MHQKKYKVIDTLLVRIIPEQVRHRKLPEEFAAAMVDANDEGKLLDGMESQRKANDFLLASLPSDSRRPSQIF